MKISTKGRYAIRVILDIAMHDDGKYIPLKDIAKRQDLTVKYLEQLISSFKQGIGAKSPSVILRISPIIHSSGFFDKR